MAGISGKKKEISCLCGRIPRGSLSPFCAWSRKSRKIFYSGYTSLSSVIWYRTSSRYFFARYLAIGRFISR